MACLAALLLPAVYRFDRTANRTRKSFTKGLAIFGRPESDKMQRVTAGERRRLDRVLRPSRTLVERAASAMLLHARQSQSDDVPTPPFSSVICDLHQAVAVLVACDDGLARADCV